MTSQLRLSSMVQSFFTQHLTEHKQVSPRTVTAYRDTFRLLFTFVQNKTSHTPSEVEIQELDAPMILEFLDHLESARSNQARSRNARLSAIRSFFKYASLRDVEHLAIANRVLAIPNKRAARPMITYLTRPEVDAILAVPNRETWLGSRDHALLLALYNTGARSSEMTGATRGQVSFGSTALFQLHGKGRKERTVPLWPQTARVLHRWFQMVEGDDRTLAFPSIRGIALSADALDYLLQCAVKKASTTCPDLATKRVTPHVMRHTTAMHLL